MLRKAYARLHSIRSWHAALTSVGVKNIPEAASFCHMQVSTGSSISSQPHLPAPRRMAGRQHRLLHTAQLSAVRQRQDVDPATALSRVTPHRATARRALLKSRYGTEGYRFLPLVCWLRSLALRSAVIVGDISPSSTTYFATLTPSPHHQYWICRTLVGSAPNQLYLRPFLTAPR